MNPKTITLCGSTRFQSEFERLERELTLEGRVVLGVGVYGHGRDADAFAGMDPAEKAAAKRILDGVHRRKIDMCGSIFVVNPSDYIGESTWREIAYAAMTGKGIASLAPIGQDAVFGQMELRWERAERLAAFQLEAAHHENWVDIEGYVTLRHKGNLVLDPWVLPDMQGEPFAWQMHGRLGIGVNPAEAYPRKKMAKFVFEADQAMEEYRRLCGRPLFPEMEEGLR